MYYEKYFKGQPSTQNIVLKIAMHTLDCPYVLLKKFNHKKTKLCKRHPFLILIGAWVELELELLYIPKIWGGVNSFQE